MTRSRPKVDRIACPWLIRRFIDPNAVFLFVLPTEVTAVAERFNATPFDIEGVFWSHRGETCTFDTMIEEFSLKTDPLLQLAKIVRGADTACPDLTPQSAGLRPGSNPWVDSLLGNQLPEHARPTVLRALQVSAVWLALWLVPVAALLWTLGSGNVFSENLSGAIG